MHCTLPPLLAKDVISLFFLVTGKAEVDLRPVKGATMLACTGVVWLGVATEADEIMVEAISYTCLWHFALLC